MPVQYVRVQPRPGRATITEAKWDKLAEDLQFTALDSVRATAGKWTGTIATLLAIFGIVTLVKGPEDVTKVTGTWGPGRLPNAAIETWILVLLGLTVALAASATLLSASAAYGLPRSFRFVGASVRRLHREEAAKAARRLFWARWAAIGAVLCLSVAIGITWLNTPPKPESPTKILLLDKNGIRACGDLLPGTSLGQLSVLEEGEKQATQVAVTDLTSVGTIASCPGS
jgi:hypothetical protein